MTTNESFEQNISHNKNLNKLLTFAYTRAQRTSGINILLDAIRLAWRDYLGEL